MWQTFVADRSGCRMHQESKTKNFNKAFFSFEKLIFFNGGSVGLKKLSWRKYKMTKYLFYFISIFSSCLKLFTLDKLKKNWNVKKNKWWTFAAEDLKSAREFEVNSSFLLIKSSFSAEHVHIGFNFCVNIVVYF